jgi:predicted peroxiredoxin
MFCFRRRGRIGAVLSGVVISALSGCAAAPGASDGVFVHISSGPEDAHRVLMGLQMAKLMAEEQDVLVYFDVHGIQVVLQDAADFSMEPFGSAQESVKTLLAREVPVYACPGCLKAAGKAPDDLMPGIQVAKREAFFDFTRGRLLTLDY